MSGLFGEDPPAAIFQEKAAAILEVMEPLWLRCLALGVDVVLDHGFWSRSERDRARRLASEAGADAVLYALSCEEEESGYVGFLRATPESRSSLYIAPGNLSTLLEGCWCLRRWSRTRRLCSSRPHRSAEPREDNHENPHRPPEGGSGHCAAAGALQRRGPGRTPASEKASAMTQFGVDHLTLRPGARSSRRHWHEEQEEFVYVRSGVVTLCDLKPGDHLIGEGGFAGFPAGEPNARHHLVNRSDAPVVELDRRRHAQGCGEERSSLPRPAFPALSASSETRTATAEASPG